MWIVFSSTCFLVEKDMPSRIEPGSGASLPNVAPNDLGRGGVILALKDVATFEGEDDPLVDLLGTITDWADGKR
jgi:hypothetical protein